MGLIINALKMKEEKIIELQKKINNYKELTSQKPSLVIIK